MDHLITREVEPRDWPDVMRRAERGRGLRWVVRRLIPAAGLAAAMAVLAILFVRLANPEEGSAPAAEPLRFATLERPQQSGDQGRGAGISVDPSSVRRATTVDGTSYFLARSHGGEICIWSLEAGDGGSTACGTEETIRQAGAITMDTPGARDRGSTLTGIVPDGVTRARAGELEVAVTNNVYVLTAPDGVASVQILTQSGWQQVGVPIDQPGLAVLRRPQEERDRSMSPEALGVLADVGIRLDSTRLLRDVVGVPYFVGQRRDGAACLIKGGTDRLFACGSASPLVDGDVVEISVVPRGAVAARVGLVTDGVAGARPTEDIEVEVSNNLYSFSGPFVGLGLRIGDTVLSTNSQNFGLLSRPRSPDDALPQPLLSLPIDHGITPNTTNPQTVRRVGRIHGETYWASGGSVTLCLHATPDQRGCVIGEESFNRGALIFAPGATGEYWTRDLAGIVEDGFETATVGVTTVGVLNNVFVFDGRPPGSTVTLAGPGKSRVVELQGEVPRP
jgi:hypothetical protein